MTELNCAERSSLGTAKAAVESYVNLLACALSTDELQLHYWLDAYYQLRQRYEDERQPETVSVQKYPDQDISAPAPTDPPPTLADEPPKPTRGTFTGYGATLRRKTHDRLLELRREGVSVQQLVKASGGQLGDARIYQMINAEKVNMKYWELMADALDMLIIPDTEET